MAYQSPENAQKLRNMPRVATNNAEPMVQAVTQSLPSTETSSESGINWGAIGEGLRGFGAGYAGRGAEFVAGLNKQNERLDKSRQDAMLKDLSTMDGLLSAGLFPEALQLGVNRADSIDKLGGDSRDTRSLVDLMNKGEWGKARDIVKTEVNTAIRQGHFKSIDKSMTDYQAEQIRLREIELDQAKRKQAKPSEGSYTIQDVGGIAYKVNKKTGDMEEVDPVGNKAKEEEKKMSKQNALFADLSTLDRTIDNIDDAFKLADVAGGEYYLLKDMPGSLGGNSKILNATLQPIIAALGFDKLQDMRNKSPTGGALGQVSNIELNMLQSAVESLVMAAETSPKELRAALTNVKESYTNYKAALLGKTAQVDWNKYPEYVTEVDGQRYWKNPKDENSDVFLIGPVPKKAPPKKVSPTASGENQ